MHLLRGLPLQGHLHRRNQQGGTIRLGQKLISGFQIAISVLRSLRIARDKNDLQASRHAAQGLRQQDPARIRQHGIAKQQLNPILVPLKDSSRGKRALCAKHSVAVGAKNLAGDVADKAGILNYKNRRIGPRLHENFLA